MAEVTTLACRCGKVRLDVSGTPIIASECYCTSCRTAGGRFEALPDAAPVLNERGGTPYVLCRKDRVAFMAGTELLREYRLTPDSPTRRVVASCCNTPIFTEFQNGHWLSLYARLWPEAERPAMQLRTMVSDLPQGVVLDERLPNAKQQNLAFFARLLGAWLAMGFRVPKLDFVKEELNA